MNEVVTIVLQLLPLPNLSRVEALPVVAVDGLRTGRPEGDREGGEGERGERCERQ